jgi:hypothetical protein
LEQRAVVVNAFFVVINFYDQPPYLVADGSDNAAAGGWFGAAAMRAIFVERSGNGRPNPFPY